MIRPCNHAAVRFRTFLLLFALVSLYSIIWLFNLQVVSYNTVSKSAADSDVSTLTQTMNHTTKNPIRRELKQQFANETEENKNKNDQKAFNVTEKTSVTVITLANLNKTEIKRTGKTDKETADDIKRSALNDNSIYNQNANVEEPIAELPKYKHSVNVSDSNHRDNVSIPFTHHIQAKQKGSMSTISEKSVIQQQYRASNITSIYRPNAYTINDFKPESAVNMTNRTISPNQEHSNLIQMTLKEAPELQLNSSRQSDLTFADQNSNKLGMSLIFEPKAKRLNNSSIDQKANMSETSRGVTTTNFEIERERNVSGRQVVNMSNSSNHVLLSTVNETNAPYYEQLLSQDKELTSLTCNHDELHVSNKTKIGILIPSSTRKIQSPYLHNLTLINTSLPSIYKTLEVHYVYRIYIGIDEGDFLQTVQEDIKTMFDCVIPVIVHGKNYVKSVNTIAQQAYEDGMDYLVRINDDTLFVSSNWTSVAIDKLKKYNPENIGVVGPTCNEGNTKILTHDMVHRKHLEIFDFYYPPYLENWWTDDWITHVYEPNKSTRLASWIVKHIILKTRYEVDYEREQWSKTLIEYDKNRLQKYIGCSDGAYIARLDVSIALTWMTCLIIHEYFLFINYL